ncbi:TP6A-N domain-containing protein [Aphelenchoides besseyi]|nr:TP6A-N domain-containing protein [Aphelenchoides besseyi]
MKDESDFDIVLNDSVMSNDEDRGEVTIRMIQETIIEFLNALKEATMGLNDSNEHVKTLKTIVISSPVDDVDERLVFNSTSNGLARFARQIRTLVQIFTLLVNERRATKRDLFYQGKHLYGKQDRLDRNVSKFCRFFSRARYELNVMSSGKGCVMGRLQLVNKYGKILNFDAAPIAIVEDLCDFEHIFIDTTFILVVEKDSMFRSLIDNGFFEHLPDVLLVTARGFPDFSTRYFLRWLLDMRPIPLFVLVDYDPFGFHIFMEYRYGNPKTMVESGDILLPEAQLFGMTSAQVDGLDLQKLPLTEGDHKRLKLVKKLSKSFGDVVVENEIRNLENRAYKVQLEAWAAIEPDYLIRNVLKPHFDILRTCRSVITDIMDCTVYSPLA